MKVIKTELENCVIIEPIVHEDHRGVFVETFQTLKYASEAGIKFPFVQDNYSRSFRGVLRGLHYQQTKPQGRLIRVVHGEVFDVAVDLRPDSSTFRQWSSIVLSGQNMKQIWIPPGFAHGCCLILLIWSTSVRNFMIQKMRDKFGGMIRNLISLGRLKIRYCQ